MKILVCGNINSGKSYFIDKLTSHYRNFSVIQIDEWRKKYGDGTIEGEQQAQKKFIEEVINTENAFVELSGMGPLGRALAEKIDRKTFIVLYIKECLEVCLSRLASKQLSIVPYPKFNEQIDDTIIRIDTELNSGGLHSLWKDKALSILDITENSMISDIPIMHYKYLIEVLNIMMCNDKINEIVLYGSVARNELSNLSDIDLFITTDYNVNDIQKLFLDMPNLDFIDNEKNKIILLFSDILIEIVVVKKIHENIKYYVNSYITDISTTLIKGNDDTYKELLFANKEFLPDIDKLKRETVQRLIYFLVSLEKIAKKCDDYKFFFHNNIIIHEITRLLYFDSNKIEYDYLPHDALSYYTGISIQDLLYDFKKDKYDHISRVKIIVYELLTKMHLFQDKYSRILK